MSEFTIYGIPGSPYVRAALLGLEEKGADWRLVPMGPGDMRGPAHVERHALAASPSSNPAISACTRPRRSCATWTASCPNRR